MRVVLVADADPAAGLGHLSRTSALGAALERRGVQVAAYGLGAKRRVERDGVRWAPLEDLGRVSIDGVRAVVLDSYSADPADLPPGTPVVLMHDQGTPTPAAALVVSVAARGGAGGRLLAGPRYACLRPMFAGLSERAQPDAVRRILVTVGGTAAAGLGGRIAKAVAAGAGDDVVVSLVVPPPGDAGVPAGVQAVRAPDSLRDALLAADLVVSAAGQTMLEALAAGAPCVAVVTADNQRRQADRLADLGAVVLAPSADPLEVAGMAAALAGDPGGRRRFAARGREVVDGRGADRVAAAVAMLAEARA